MMMNSVVTKVVPLRKLACHPPWQNHNNNGFFVEYGRSETNTLQKMERMVALRQQAGKHI